MFLGMEEGNIYRNIGEEFLCIMGGKIGKFVIFKMIERVFGRGRVGEWLFRFWDGRDVCVEGDGKDGFYGFVLGILVGGVIF